MLFDVRGVRDGAWQIVAVVGEVDLATADTTAAMVITVGRALSTRLERILVEARRGEAVAPATTSEAK